MHRSCCTISGAVADVVPFPSPDPVKLPPLCGQHSTLGIRVHVWADDADVGDPCQCGARRLPESARPFLNTDATA
jgi:hypothetical protein